DGRHDAHVHEHLDDLGRLDRHLLRQLRDAHRLADADLAHYGRRWHLEPVASVGAARHGARFDTALLLVAGTDIRRDVQLLPSVSSVAVIRRRRTIPGRCGCRRRALARGRCRRRGCGGTRRLLRDGRFLDRAAVRHLPVLHLPLLHLALLLFALAALLFLPRPLLGEVAGLVLRPAPGGFLFLDATAVLRLQPLALAPLGIDAFALAAGDFLGLAPLLVDLVLLLARLLLEHVAFDVGALLADLDADRARASLGARQLQLALRLALQRDAPWRGIPLALRAAVAATQMGQQLELRIVADAVIGPIDLDPGLIELHEQPIHRYLQDLGKLGNGHFRHTFRTLRPDPLRTSGPGRS